jgi:hypothetical protein
MSRFEPLAAHDLELVERAAATRPVRIRRHPTLDAYLTARTIRAVPPSPLEDAILDYLDSTQLRRAA